MYLPVASTDKKHSFGSGSRVPRRYSKLVFYVLLTGGLLTGLTLWTRASGEFAVVDIQPAKGDTAGHAEPEQKWEIPENAPPDYAGYRLNETKFPQHNPDLPFPEGRTGKYVYFSGHITGAPTGRFIESGLTELRSQSRGGGTRFKSISSRDY
jgi:hypothetical protein